VITIANVNDGEVAELVSDCCNVRPVCCPFLEHGVDVDLLRDLSKSSGGEPAGWLNVPKPWRLPSAVTTLPRFEVCFDLFHSLFLWFAAGRMP
jgi:hypothetical protein